MSMASLGMFSMFSGAFGNSALLGVPLLMLLICAGVIWPMMVSNPYRAWNRLARIYGRAAERLLLTICYVTVIIPAGWAETSLRLNRPRACESNWMDRRSLPTSLYKQLHCHRSTEMGTSSWVSRYIAWAISSKQLWAFAVLPFFSALVWLKEEEDSVVRESIYTLF